MNVPFQIGDYVRLTSPLWRRLSGSIGRITSNSTSTFHYITVILLDKQPQNHVAVFTDEIEKLTDPAEIAAYKLLCE